MEAAHPASGRAVEAREVSRAIDELFALATTPGVARPTRLQSAHFANGEFRDDYGYNADESIWLAGFVRLLAECRWVPAYAARPDGGGACFDEDGGAPPAPDAGMDAGVEDSAVDGSLDAAGPADGEASADGGGPADGDLVDAGGPAAPDATPPDAGAGPTRRCECPLPPRDLDHCAP